MFDCMWKLIFCKYLMNLQTDKHARAFVALTLYMWSPILIRTLRI